MSFLKNLKTFQEMYIKTLKNGKLWKKLEKQEEKSVFLKISLVTSLCFLIFTAFSVKILSYYS